MSQPSIFLGSSGEQLEMAQEIAGKLGYSALVHVWDDVFPAGHTTLASLMDEANKVDFAAFIFAPDDQVVSRSSEMQGPRDNVIFEAGLFGGILGMERSIIIYAKGAKLPSDLEGLTPINYNPEHPQGQSAGYIAHELKKVMEDQGWSGSGGLARQLAGDWWQYNLGPAEKENNVMGFITIRREAPRIVSLSGTAYSDEGNPVARFESRAANLDEGQKRLFYYWEGAWPGQKGVPEFFGTGEIKLTDGQSAEGYFTVNSVGDKDMREKIGGSYRRATPEDAQIMKGEVNASVKDLIKKQLERRSAAAFA
jgi:hypothetical protein